MKFDDILKKLGEFGPYQRRIYFLLCLPAISCALHKLVWVFIGAIPPHRCQAMFEIDFNETVMYDPPYLLNSSILYDSATGKYDSCHRYKVDSTYLQVNISNYNSNNSIPKHLETETCNTWVYDNSQYESSTVSDFNLVCDRSWLRALVQSLFMGGELLGSILWGSISDRCGRKIVFFVSVIMQAIFGILSGVVSNYYLFLLFRMIVGLFTPGVFLVGFVIGMELVGPSKRLIAGVACQFFFATGYLLTAAMAYFIREWHLLQVVISLPGLCFVAYWWLVPESARWLLAKQQVDNAKLLLQKVAKTNGTVLPEEISELHHDESEKQESNPLLLLKYPNLRRRTLIIFFSWFVNSGVYYGLVLNSSNLGGDDYVNFVIAALLEYPAYTYCISCLNKHGRRIPLCVTMVIAGIALILTSFVPADNTSLIITFAMIGKLGITTSYAIIYIFSTELFPTVVRNIGLGMSSTFARIGGVLAPFVILLADHWKPLPLIIFGIISLLSGVLSLTLPETKQNHLPDTLEEAEQFCSKTIET